jgi:pSer/pThr/pTyr-binding forkhead associated (FHA) protein
MKAHTDYTTSTSPFFSLKGAQTREHIVELRGTTTLGRASDNTIVLDDETISRYHAVVVIEPEGVLLMDLESTNGTSVNTVPALPDAVVRLSDGDVVTIGNMALYYHAPFLTERAPTLRVCGTKAS